MPLFVFRNIGRRHRQGRAQATERSVGEFNVTVVKCGLLHHKRKPQPRPSGRCGTAARESAEHTAVLVSGKTAPVVVDDDVEVVVASVRGEHDARRSAVCDRVAHQVVDR